MGGRNRLDFSVGVGIDLISTQGSELTLFSVWVENNLPGSLEYGSKLPCLLGGGRN